ncbi:MAG: RNA methyltransferase [Deltaproteobacteria bacterium]|nr:RNA methyltransferase [Deltaproteobacteria bacterium]MCB9478361.1 RNA methyltransferase [Deltaproteobacteria bacterium]
MQDDTIHPAPDANERAEAAKVALSRVAVCLVEPQGAANIGSVARAMKNMGMTRLLLVNPTDYDVPEARMMATNAHDVLMGAEVHPTMMEAIAPFHVVVSTTRRIGKSRLMDYTPKTLAEHLSERLAEPETSAVICFGREDHGLSTEEIDLAPIVCKIPTADLHGSLNLSQAVMVIAYELWQSLAVPEVEEAGAQKRDDRRPADSDQIERFFDQIQPLLLECGFLDKNNPEWIMRALRKMVHKAELEHREIKILRGVCSDMEWYLNHVAKVGKRDGQRTLDGRGGS